MILHRMLYLLIYVDSTDLPVASVGHIFFVSWFVSARYAQPSWESYGNCEVLIIDTGETSVPKRSRLSTVFLSAGSVGKHGAEPNICQLRLQYSLAAREITCRLPCLMQA